MHLIYSIRIYSWRIQSLKFSTWRQWNFTKRGPTCKEIANVLTKCERTMCYLPASGIQQKGKSCVKYTDAEIECLNVSYVFSTLENRVREKYNQRNNFSFWCSLVYRETWYKSFSVQIFFTSRLFEALTAMNGGNKWVCAISIILQLNGTHKFILVNTWACELHLRPAAIAVCTMFNIGFENLYLTVNFCVNVRNL